MGILAIVTDVPSFWSIRGVLSLFGIIYLLFAIGVVAKGGLKGALTLFNFALIGAFLIGISGPGANPDHLPDGSSGLELYVVCKGGDYPGDGTYYYGPYVNTVRAEEHWRFSNKYNTFDRSSSYWEYDPEPKVYAMHIPDHPSYVSPKIFHPAAFFWSPFLMAVIGIVGWFLFIGVQLPSFAGSGVQRVGSAEFYRNHPDNN